MGSIDILSAGCSTLLRTLADMQERFGVLSGLSDHTIDNTTAIASVVLGAAVIEKHVNLLDIDGKPDSDISLNSQEFKKFVDAIKVNYIEPSHRKYKRVGDYRQT